MTNIITIHLKMQSASKPDPDKSDWDEDDVPTDETAVEKPTKSPVESPKISKKRKQKATIHCKP